MMIEYFIVNANSRLVIGQYFPGQSFLHLAHPGLKVVTLFTYCIFVFHLEKIEQILLILPIILLAKILILFILLEYLKMISFV